MQILPKSLNWTPELQPNEDCRYNHFTADTPFGRFLITWKGWKKYDDPVAEETPWGEFYHPHASTLEQAKVNCEQEFTRRLMLCFTDASET